MAIRAQSLDAWSFGPGAARRALEYGVPRGFIRADDGTDRSGDRKIAGNDGHVRQPGVLARLAELARTAVPFVEGRPAGGQPGRHQPLHLVHRELGLGGELQITGGAPGKPNVHLMDQVLNLPEEKHSHGLRKLAGIEAARGSHEAAAAAINRAKGVGIGKRQPDELAYRAAAHVEAFYLWHVISPGVGPSPVVLTFDGKGVVMLPAALNEAHRKRNCLLSKIISSITRPTSRSRVS